MTTDISLLSAAVSSYQSPNALLLPFSTSYTSSTREDEGSRSHKQVTNINYNSQKLNLNSTESKKMQSCS